MAAWQYVRFLRVTTIVLPLLYTPPLIYQERHEMPQPKAHTHIDMGSFSFVRCSVWSNSAQRWPGHTRLFFDLYRL